MNNTNNDVQEYDTHIFCEKGKGERKIMILQGRDVKLAMMIPSISSPSPLLPWVS